MTPSLRAVCRSLPQGAPLQVQAGGGGWWSSIGTATLSELTEDHLCLTGEAEGVPFVLWVGRADAVRATLRWQGDEAEDARWFAYGEGVVFTATLWGGALELCAWPGDGGVYVTLAGVTSAYLWFAPADGAG